MHFRKGNELPPRNASRGKYESQHQIKAEIVIYLYANLICVYAIVNVSVISDLLIKYLPITIL